jgi:lysophospholipase L1-like esterase
MTKLVFAGLVGAVLVAAGLGSPASGQGAATVPWTGTWAVAAQSSGITFNNQTLRQIVHTSIGGSVARVELSNVFGNQPLRVSDVHMAASGSGSSIVAGTDHRVTFGGAGSTMIAAGGSVASDPVTIPITALSNVAISAYLPAPTGPATAHQLGTQTNYVANGDVSGDASLSGAQKTGSYKFLTGLDVRNSAARGAVVTFGASITDGIASTQNANRRWPNDLAVRLADAGRIVGVLNAGISGNRLLTDGGGQSALHRFARDVLERSGVRWVIFSDDPINDLGSANRPTADQLIAGLKQLISQAHQHGVAFLCSTLTPFQGSGGWTPRGEQERGAINAFIRGTGSGCDAIVDQDAATHDPAHPTRYLPAYDSGDHLHPNEAGLQAIANAVPLGSLGG